MKLRVGAAAVLAVGLFGGRAFAIDAFEIQVYEGDADVAGQAGLELHSNYTASGRKSAAFAGEVVPDGLLRLTLEPSYGVTGWWELGAYLETATALGDFAGHWAGFKLRTKFIAPAARTAPLVMGANFEIGRGVAALGTAEWDIEVRPIVAYTYGRWAVAFNPIIGWAVTGSDRNAAPDFEPALKARADVGHKIALGFEYYAGLGRITSPEAVRNQEHYLYLAGDLLNGPIELNFAVGHGFTDASEAWTVKAIVGKTF